MTQEEELTELGPWDFMAGKGIATLVQKSIVPWLIAIDGLNYAKNIKLEVIKEMLIALCDMKGFMDGSMSSVQAAKKYHVAFQDTAKKVKAAAGMYCCMLYHKKSNELIHVLPRSTGTWQAPHRRPGCSD